MDDVARFVKVVGVPVDGATGPALDRADAD